MAIMAVRVQVPPRVQMKGKAVANATAFLLENIVKTKSGIPFK